MLTCELPPLQDTLQAFLEHLQGKGWTVNPQKIQGLCYTIRFWGVIWLGKIHIVPKAVIGQKFNKP